MVAQVAPRPAGASGCQRVPPMLAGPARAAPA